MPMRGYFSIKKKGEGAHRSCRRFGGGRKEKFIWMSRLNVRHCGRAQNWPVSGGCSLEGEIRSDDDSALRVRA